MNAYESLVMGSKDLEPGTLVLFERASGSVAVGPKGTGAPRGFADELKRSVGVIRKPTISKRPCAPNERRLISHAHNRPTPGCQRRCRRSWSSRRLGSISRTVRHAVCKPCSRSANERALDPGVVGRLEGYIQDLSQPLVEDPQSDMAWYSLYFANKGAPPRLCPTTSAG